MRVMYIHKAMVLNFICHLTLTSRQVKIQLVNELKFCIPYIKSLMSKNKFRLNDDKTEMLKTAQNKIQIRNIQIGSWTISACTNVRNQEIYQRTNYILGI